MIGPQLSGKKALILKWCYDIYEEEIYSSPINSLYFKKEIKFKNKDGDSDNLQSNIWYFSGGEMFKGM